MSLSSKIETSLTKQILKIVITKPLKSNNLKILKQDLTLFLNSYQLTQVSLLLLKLNPNHNNNNKKHRPPSQTRVTVSSLISALHKISHLLRIQVSILAIFFQITRIPHLRNQKSRKQPTICSSSILLQL